MKNSNKFLAVLDNLANHTILFVFCSLLIVLFSCDDLFKSDDDDPSSEGNEQTSEWKTSSSKSYEIPSAANSTTHDNISGLDFKFPEGGDGKLTVTRIVSGPNDLVVPQDSAFKVEYTGSKKIQILMKVNPGSDDFLGRYTNFDSNLCYDGGNLEGWIPEKVSSTQGGFMVYDLNLSTVVTKSAHENWEKQPVFKYIKYNKQTGWGAMSSTFRKQMNAYRETLKEYLPDARQQKFYNDAIMNMPPDLFIEMQWTWFKGGPKYVPYYSYFPAVTRCMIVQDYQSSTQNLAHEWGHYVSHVLMGDKYISFAKNPRPNKPDEHCVGLPGAKNNLIEEYAYLTEYFLTGKVGAIGSPEKGTFCVNSSKSSIKGSGSFITNEPEKVDFPDLEGFGVTLFASIVRTSNTISNYKSATVNVPVVAASLPDRKELFKICYEITAEGTNDIYEVRSKIESAIQTKFGKTDLLPAMLQPLGWSYHIKGRFVDKDGKEMEGVTAQSLTIADGKEYLLTKSTTASGKNGEFTLNEVYPGLIKLRVFYNSKSVDVTTKVTIDWTKPTNVEINVGDVVIDEESLIPYLNKTIVAGVQFEAMFSTTKGNYPLKQLVDNNTSGEKLTWGGQGFSVTKKYNTTDGPYNKYEKSVSISGSVSKNGKLIETCTASYEEKWFEVSPSTGASSLLRTIKTTITCNNIPFNTMKEDKKTISYILMGSSVQGKASMNYSEVWSDGSGLTSQNILWNDLSVNPVIVLIFIAT